MAATIMGVIKGRKYAVLKNSVPLILLFKTAAKTSGITSAITAVETANTKVFLIIKKNEGLVKSSLYFSTPTNLMSDNKSQLQKLK